MIEIALWNSPKPALVDDDQRDQLLRVWRLDKKGYVIRYGERRVRLAHAVMGKPAKGFVWDHINRDKLDNRRENLRQIPTAANAQNRGAHRNNVTGYRGVFLRKDTGRFMAHGSVDGQLHRLGYYDTPEEAAAVAAKFRKERMPFSEEASHG